MPPYTNAVADVGETLISLLREGFKDVIPRDSIILYSPGEIEPHQATQLCLSLYYVTENMHWKNREPERITETTLRRTGLVLDLYYMLIPYESSNIQDKTERTKRAHAILGKAMQVFYDNGLLRDPLLKGGLAGKGLEIRLMLNPVSLDEVTKVWDCFQTKPFLPSIAYLVTPVEIDSDRDQQVKPVSAARFVLQQT